MSVKKFFSMSISVQFCVLYFFIYYSVPALCGHEGFQLCFNGFYKRIDYEKTSFGELYSEFLEDPEFTIHDYRHTILKGLTQYFALYERLAKLKRPQKEEIHLTPDQVLLEIALPTPNKTFSFHSANGLSHINFENLSPVQGQTKYQFLFRMYLPSIVLQGIINQRGTNKSLEYLLQDVVYLNKQNKKLDVDGIVSSTLSSEKFYINSTKLKIDGNVTEESVYSKMQPEIVKDVTKHMNTISEYLKSASLDITLKKDVDIMTSKKDEIIERLSKVVAKTVKNFEMVNVSLPRFSFYDHDSGTTYDLISGALDVDIKNSNVSASATPSGDFLLSGYVEGNLTFFITEQNCTEFCHTFGTKARIMNPSVLVTFAMRKLDKVSIDFELESITLQDYHYLKKPSDFVTKSMMNKLTKILSDRLLARIRLFLK